MNGKSVFLAPIPTEYSKRSLWFQLAGRSESVTPIALLRSNDMVALLDNSRWDILGGHHEKFPVSHLPSSRQPQDG